MSQNEHDILDVDVVQVQKQYFFDGLVLPTNLYIKLTSGRYLLIGKKDEKVQFSSLASFQRPDSEIFVLKIEYEEFIRMMTNFTEQLVQKPELPAATKARFIQGLTDHVMGLFGRKNFSNEQQLNRVSKMVLNLCQDVRSFDEVTKILDGLTNDESRHAMSTCMISILISEEMGIKQPNIHEKIIKASLLHDVGLRYIPPEIIAKPQHSWTPQERLIYENHPIQSAEILRDLKDISNDILIMITEHHENALGTGYPKRIRDVKISPLGRILIVADYFTDLLFERIESTKVYDAPAAIEYIENVLGQPFNKQVFRALKNMINKDELKKRLQG